MVQVEGHEQRNSVEAIELQRPPATWNKPRRLLEEMAIPKRRAIAMARKISSFKEGPRQVSVLPTDYIVPTDSSKSCPTVRAGFLNSFSIGTTTIFGTSNIALNITALAQPSKLIHCQPANGHASVLTHASDLLSCSLRAKGP